MDLQDGFDTRSTAELHDLYACLDGGGALLALAPLDAALDAPTRDGAAGTVLAAWGNDLPEQASGLSLAALARDARAALDDPQGIHETAHATLEIVYGRPWPLIADGTVLNARPELDAGILAPALPVLGEAARATLDADHAPLDVLAEVLRSPELPRWAWTAASALRSGDPALAPIGANWATDLEDALGRARSPENDRWAGASGDSLMDLGRALAGETDARGDLPVAQLGATLLPLLQDASVQRAAVTELRGEAASGRLRDAPLGVLHLASVDMDGGALTPGEDSALYALLRLLRRADAPLDCSVDLWVVSFDVSLDNLSVALLETLADMEPGSVEGGVDILGDLLGFGLTDPILETVADLGVCPTLDREMVRDLHALDRLGDREAAPLLRSLLALLRATRPRLDAVVASTSLAWDSGWVPPVEELARDLAEAPLVDDALRAVPALTDPWAHHARVDFPAGVDPLDVDSLWELARTGLEPGRSGESPLSRMSPPISAVLSREETPVVLARTASLLAAEDSVVRGLVEGLPDTLAEDPMLTGAYDLSDLVEDEGFVRPLLVLVETEALHEAVLFTEPTQPGPLPWAASLVVGDTLDALLSTLDLLSTLLPESPSDE